MYNKVFIQNYIKYNVFKTRLLLHLPTAAFIVLTITVFIV